MTLVDDDEVEEVGRELLVDVLIFLGSGDGLVQREIDLEGLVRRAIRNLGHGLAERFEVVRLGLVGEDVSVDEEEDSLLRARFPKPPDDLKRRVRLSGAGSHDEQNPVLPQGDRLHRSIDGNLLVVTRHLPAAIVVIVLRGDAFLAVGESFRCAIPAPEVLRRRELLQSELPFDGSAARQPIMLEERIAVGAVGEGDVERLRVVERLLHAGTHRVVVVLGLDHGQWQVGLIEKDVVGLPDFAAGRHLPANDHASLREGVLFENLGHHVPSGQNCRRDEFRPNVGLGQSLLVH